MIRISILLASFVCVSALLCGQGSEVEKRSLKGIYPSGSYALSEFETINTGNGNVMLKLPLVSLPPARAGWTASVNLIYNSKIWEGDATVTRPAGDRNVTIWALRSNEDGGWKYGTRYTVYAIDRRSNYESETCPSQSVAYPWRYEVEFPDGSTHPLTPIGAQTFDGTWFNRAPTGGRVACQLNHQSGTWGETTVADTSPFVFYTTDGTYVRVETPVWTNNVTASVFVLRFPDGRRVESGAGGQFLLDRNSNQVTLSSSTDPATSITTETIADAVGRTIALTRTPRASNAATETISAKGFGGTNATTLTWTIHRRKLDIASTRQYRSYSSRDFTGPQPPAPETVPGGLWVVSKIDTPAQLTNNTLGTLPYQFGYGEVQGGDGSFTTSMTGELRSVTLPSGAQTTYEYELDTPGGTLAPSYEQYVENKIKKKTLTYPGQQTAEIWQYGIGNFASSVTAPDGGITNEYRSLGLVYRTDYPDGSRTEKVWKHNNTNVADGQPVIGWNLAGGTAYNPFVAEEYRTIVNQQGVLSKTAVTRYTVDRNGNTTGTETYDWLDYASLTRQSDGRPQFPAGLTLLRSVTTQFHAPILPNSGSICNANTGFYCSAGAGTLTSVRQQTTTGTGTGAATAYCYDNPLAQANVLHEARWDSAKGTLPGTLINCAQGRTGASTAVVTSYTYTASGNVETVTDPRGFVTRNTYGSVGSYSDLYPTQITTAEGQTEAQTITRAYDLWTGVVTSETDINSIADSRTYDAFGRLTSLSKGGDFTEWTYSDQDQFVLTKTRQATQPAVAWQSTIERLDPLGRPGLTQVFTTKAAPAVTDQASGIKTDRRYFQGSAGTFELASNPYESTTEATMGWTRTKRDTMGRVVEVTTYSGAALPAPWGNNATTTGTVATVYNGDRTRVTDQASAAREQRVDAAGRLVEVVEAPGVAGLGHSTIYSYDALDKLTGVSQGGQTRSFFYTSLGRLRRAENPERDAIDYTYDDNGNLLTRVDSANTVTMAYDAQDRVLSKIYTGQNAPTSTTATPNVVYCYDGRVSTGGGACATANPPIAHARGQLTAVSSTASTSQFTNFDPQGRVLASQQITGATYGFTYAYDGAGNLTQMTYPVSGRTVSWEYDGAGRTTLARNGATGTTHYASNLAYAPHGGLTALRLGNNLWEGAAFNARLQPTELRLGTTNGASGLWRLENGFGATDNNGNVRTQRLTVPGATAVDLAYSYDPLNRLLVAAERPANLFAPTCPDTNSVWCQQFGYDRWGNRTIVQRTNAPSNNNDPASFNTLTNRITGGTWQYDARGNVTRDNEGTSFAFDAENRQRAHCPGEATGCDATRTGQRTVYHYDGDGRRVRIEDPQRTTVFVYDAAGKLASEFVVVGQAPADLPAGTHYLTTDHLGTTRVVTNGAGGIVERRDYRPFGEDILASAGTWRQGLTGYGATNNLRVGFTGQLRDNESKLDYFGARYFSWQQGRFTSPDETLIDQHAPDPQSWNLYAYVRNNPLRTVDPTGNVAETLWDAFNIGLGVYSFGKNAWQGNWSDAAVDAGGVALDVAAAVTPFVPGGAGTAIKAGRAAEKIADGAKLVNKLDGAADAAKDTNVVYRGQALGKAKQDAGVPRSQQPEKQESVVLTDQSGKQVVINGKPQTAREYTHTTGSGKKVVIQDHRQGHSFPDGGKQGPHFNVRPQNDVRHGVAEGTKAHYPYRPRKQEE